MQATTVLLQVRIPFSVRAELERRAERLRAEHPGLPVSVSGVAREALLAGLKEGCDVPPE